MSNRTSPVLLSDLTSNAARRMLPEQTQTSKPASPRIVADLPDNESLAVLLKSLGYTVEVQRFAGGEATCLISRDAGDSRHTIEVELSPGARRIWLTARIGPANLHRKRPVRGQMAVPRLVFRRPRRPHLLQSAECPT